MIAPNTGYTSYCDSDGAQVLSSIAELVTAHELGHSWGAPHDPSTSECNPPAERGGRYLMYTFAVSGYSPNNYVSPASQVNVKLRSGRRRRLGHCVVKLLSLDQEAHGNQYIPMNCAKA